MRKIPTVKQSRKSVHDVVGKPEHFAEFPGGATAPVSDDVGGHRRTVGRVASINFLDDRFAKFAAGEIEVDIGPGGAAVGTDAAFAEKALEK